jgi:hypothetical protein
MPSYDQTPRDDLRADPVRSRAVSSIVEGLRHGFLVPENPETPESDFGSTAGRVYEQLVLDGFEVVERQK